MYHLSMHKCNLKYFCNHRRKKTYQTYARQWNLRIQDSKVHLLLLDSCQNQFQVADSQPPEFQLIFPTIKKSAIEMKYSKQKSNKKIQMIFIILDIDSYYQSSALLLSFLPEYLFLVIVLIDWCKGYWTIFGQYWAK